MQIYISTIYFGVLRVCLGEDQDKSWIKIPHMAQNKQKNFVWFLHVPRHAVRAGIQRQQCEDKIFPQISNKNLWKTHQNRRHGTAFGFVFIHLVQKYEGSITFHRPCFLPQRVHRIQSCEEDLLAALPTYLNLGCSPWRSVVLVRVSSRVQWIREKIISYLSRTLDDICVFLTLDGNSSVLNLLIHATNIQWSSLISECSACSGSVIIASHRILFIVGKGQAMDGLLSWEE